MVDTIDLERLAVPARLVKFAQYLFWMADQITSGTIKNIFGKTKKLLRLKAELYYLELHLTDHCNLNCRGCAHFCPIAEKWFADPAIYVRDMLQLRKLFSTIRTIRLMGGEALLHPKIEFFLFSTRSVFPKSDIRLVTNGILLNDMPNSFWDACRTCFITIDITIYPPFENKKSFFIELANSKGVKIKLLRAPFFIAIYNKNGDSDIGISFKNCVMKTFNLREGRLYPCPINAYGHYFNRQYGTQIPVSGSIDIYSPKLTGWDVIELLKRAPLTCCYCTLGWDNLPTFQWSKSKRTITEWDATIDRNVHDWLENPFSLRKVERVKRTIRSHTTRKN